MPYQCPIGECGSTHDSEQGLAMHLRHTKDGHGKWATISDAYQDIGKNDYYTGGPGESKDDVDDDGDKSPSNETPSTNSAESAPSTARESSSGSDPSREFPPDGTANVEQSGRDDVDDVDDDDDGEIVCPDCGSDLYDYRSHDSYEFDYWCGACEVGYKDE